MITMHEFNRIMANVDVRGIHDCWPYKLGKTKDGYGRTRAGSRTDGTMRSVLTHRVLFEYIDGELGPDEFVLHKRACNNPACNNWAAHLYRGSKLDNAHDRDATTGPGMLGRGGPDCPNTRIPLGAVYALINEYEEMRAQRWRQGQVGKMRVPRQALAQRYDVSPGYVHDLVSGRRGRRG